MDRGCVVISVMSGADDGKVFEFHSTPIMLGRHPSDDVYLPHDSRVSRRHARISCDNASYFVEDLGPEGKGSTNGTFLNGQQVVDKTPVSPGDVLLLGTVWLRFDAFVVR